jgi:hypothetical protein
MQRKIERDREFWKDSNHGFCQEPNSEVSQESHGPSELAASKGGDSGCQDSRKGHLDCGMTNKDAIPSALMSIPWQKYNGVGFKGH